MKLGGLRVPLWVENGYWVGKSIAVVVSMVKRFYFSRHGHLETRRLPHCHIVDARWPDSTIDTSVPKRRGEGWDEESCGMEHFRFLNNKGC